MSLLRITVALFHLQLALTIVDIAVAVFYVGLIGKVIIFLEILSPLY